MKLPVLTSLPDGSDLLRAAGQRVRGIDATTNTAVKDNTADYRLVTMVLYQS